MDLTTKNSCFMEDLYRRHERLMYFIAGKYTADAQRREDIVQTAVVSLLRKEATLRRLPPYAQINYIAAAVRNTAINALKREQKELDRCISLEDLTETFPSKCVPSAETIVLEKELQKDLLAVFQEMKEDEQQLLMGKYLMSLSDAELAQTLGCKASSIRMKLTRARRTFLKKLQNGVLQTKVNS